MPTERENHIQQRERKQKGALQLPKISNIQKRGVVPVDVNHIWLLKGKG